jgi:guanosine-3',5'-bis(diphosphate) 3'-pyrophosphohydrolase
MKDGDAWLFGLPAMSNSNQANARLLEAIAFAVRAHQGQWRKDGKTPYASHPFRVCLVVRHNFGIDDPAVLSAGVLHDTIEDTPTDFDDLEKCFGAQVAGWVALLTKDMRLPEAQREEAYKAALARSPWQVQVCKLGDIYDNLTDARHLSAQQRQRTCQRSRAYLAAMDNPAVPANVRQAFQLTSDLLKELEQV